MGFAIRRAEIPGLQDFLLRLYPSSPDAGEDPFLKPFWEETFQCSLGAQSKDPHMRSEVKPPCSGTEELGNVKNIYSDVSQLRISYNVYKAVYAIAHAIKAMRSCVTGHGPFSQQACPDLHNIQPWQVCYSKRNVMCSVACGIRIDSSLFLQLHHYIKQVNYMNRFGDEIKFDGNGDPAAMYDLINWQLNPKGDMEFVTVGKFDEIVPAGRKNLHIEEGKIVWNGNKTQVGACSNIYQQSGTTQIYILMCAVLQSPLFFRYPCQYAVVSAPQVAARQSDLISLSAAMTVWFVQQGRLAMKQVRRGRAKRMVTFAFSFTLFYVSSGL